MKARIAAADFYQVVLRSNKLENDENSVYLRGTVQVCNVYSSSGAATGEIRAQSRNEAKPSSYLSPDVSRGSIVVVA
jgi:hypothetical protein